MLDEYIPNHNQHISPPLGSDSDQSLELEIKANPLPVRRLRRSYAVSNMAPSQSNYKPDKAKTEPVSGADWEMVDETPKSKKKAKPKMQNLIEATNECKVQENDSEDNMVSTSTFFVNFNR